MDRNTLATTGKNTLTRSPPARVAWIETLKKPNHEQDVKVATREGGVDRNIRVDGR